MAGLLHTRLARNIGALTFAGAAVVAPPIFQPLATGYQAASLTRDGTVAYSLNANDGTVTASAPATSWGGNTRAVFWPSGQANLAKAQACATLSTQEGATIQQGLALRIKAAKNGSVRAVTVTKNIFTTDPRIPGTWIFNVHVWRSNQRPAFVQVGSFDLERVFAAAKQPFPLPWRLCARVQGRLLMFEAWRVGQPKPAWNDTTHGGSVKLPGGWGYAGQNGWYVGHLQAGDHTSFTNLVAGAPTAILP